MNAALLLEHYAQIADAPDAIARLRRFILDLAVRGKLVEQAPNDEPASELLKRIAAERARLVKVGEAQKGKDLSPAAEDAEFDLPQSWNWARLGSITSYIQRGKSPTYAEVDGLPVVSQKCVQWSGLNLGAARLITRQSLEKYEKIRFLQDGDLLWNSTGTGTIGRIILIENVPDNLICDSHVTVVRCLCVLSEYIRIWLRSDHVYGVIEDRAAGSTNQVELTAQMATNQVVPIPPLAEQHRIVAKVDELMALCDQLETAQAEREAGRDKLTRSTLAKLNEPDPETFADDARFALEHLEPLTKRTDQIKQLRLTILNLAVRGKLVTQDAADEPASELLKRIASSSPVKKASNAADVQAFYELPIGWEWTYLGKLVSSSGSGWSPKTADHPRTGNEWGVLKVSAVSWGTFRPWENKQVLPGTVPRLQAKVVVGDFLISRANTAELIARSVIVDEEPINLMMSDKIVRLAISPYVNQKYVSTVNNHADFARAYYAERATGVSPSMKNVSRDTILGLPVPLPPLAEQDRIVAKVDELMALCDQLEASLIEGEQTRSKLLESVLHKALEPITIT